MNRLIQSTLAIFMSMGFINTHAQCEADTTVYLTDFIFTPSEFTISVGQTVAFVNAEGTHNVDGTERATRFPFSWKKPKATSTVSAWEQ